MLRHALTTCRYSDKAVFPDDGVEAGKRRAGEKGGFGVRFGRMDGPRPGRERRRRSGRKALDCLRITAREHAETLRRGGAFA